MGIIPELSMSCSSASGRGLLRFLSQTGVWSVGRCVHLCQDTVSEATIHAALTCLSDSIATAVIPSQFACKETVFKRKNKLHFIFP